MRRFNLTNKENIKHMIGRISEYKTISALALIFIVLPATVQAFSLTGTLTTGTKGYNNKEKATWVYGTITVSCTAAEALSNPQYTVDLAPRQELVNGICPRNANWRHYDNSGSNEQVYIDNVEIYVGNTTLTNSAFIQQWDAPGIGDSSITSGNVFAGQFSKETTSKTFDFSAVFWNLNDLEAGYYELPITFRLRVEPFSTSGPKTDPVSTLTMVLRYYVGTAATIFFTPGSRSKAYNGSEIFNVDFGEVTTSASQEFTIHVQSNFKFNFYVQSLNGGVLRHPKYSQATTDDERSKREIGYTLRIGGNTIPLKVGTSQRISTQNPTTAFGTTSQDYSAVITLDFTQDYDSGTYTDYLSFTVKPY